MPKTVVLLCLLLFSGHQVSAQHDSINFSITDTTALANTRAVAVYKPVRGKKWPAAAIIAAIIISSYVLYNVRSK